MYHGLFPSPSASFAWRSARTELGRSLLRRLILVTAGGYLGWQLVVPMLSPDIGWRAAPVTLVVIPTATLALWLAGKRLWLAQLTWYLGFLGAVTLALRVFQEPIIGFAYSLLPLMAVLTMGFPGMAATVGLLVAIATWLGGHPALPSSPPTQLTGVVVGGMATGLMGWAAAHEFLHVTRWSLHGYDYARRRMEEAREQRVQLKEAQEDLLLANRELARLSDRLRAMHQVAEDARRAKEEFVANVSHELRTPLNLIIGFAEMIMDSPRVYGTALPRAVLGDVAAIERNARHLARLVDDVLDLSQVEAGQMALTREWAYLPEIIASAVEGVRLYFESKGLALQVEVADDLPMLYCDVTRMHQVLINLLSNAGRFTERGHVRVEARRQGGEVLVSVADTGPGIAPEDQHKVFQPFRQIDGSIRRRHGGTGLGLHISRRFVEMHGGRMWMESEVGVGTTVFLSLPIEGTAPPLATQDGGASRWIYEHDDAGFRARTRRSRAPAPHTPPRYVLVEEGEIMSRLLHRYLHDAEIVAVRDLDAALQELARSPAQALVINADDQLAAPTGLSALSRVPYGTPVVSCHLPGQAEAARRLGVVDYLVKPVSRDALLSTLSGLGRPVRSVLLVDDEPEALQLFSRMLVSAGRGYQVLRAESGPQALSLLRAQRPDVVLLDLVMPGMDGFQVLREKGQDAALRDIPVVIISSQSPSGEPVVADNLTVARSGGLSARDLLSCLQAVSQILAPASRTARREPSETPAG